jgi:hypothetical protein
MGGTVPTKDELEAENAELREQLAAARAEADVSRETSAPKRPERPQQLSAGEADDLAQFGVCISPFDGATLNALDYGIEPANPEAKRTAERHAANRDDAQVIVDAQRAKALGANVSRETSSEDPAGQ